MAEWLTPLLDLDSISAKMYLRHYSESTVTFFLIQRTQVTSISPRKSQPWNQTFQLIQFNFQNRLPHHTRVFLNAPFLRRHRTTIISLIFFFSSNAETLPLLNALDSFQFITHENLWRHSEADATPFRYNRLRRSLFRAFRERHSKRRVVESSNIAIQIAVLRDRFLITAERWNRAKRRRI